MLKEQRGGEGIDVSLSTAGGSAHLANGAKGGGRGVALVNETHGKARPFLDLGGHLAGFGRPRRVVTIAVEGQANDIPLNLELGTAADHLGDRRTLAAATFDEPGR
jgi:hypothetical protein